MSTEIIISVVASILGIIVGAGANYLVTKNKVAAEIRKLEAETGKTNMEAAKLSRELAELASQRCEGQADSAIKKIEVSKTYLFGYFFVENDGVEKRILEFIGPNSSFLMNGEIVDNTTSIEEAIDEIVLWTINQNGITKEQLLAAGLSQPIHYRLFVKKDKAMLATPYIFFKIGLQSEFTSPNCRWHDKKLLAAPWHEDNQTLPLQWPNTQEISEIFRKDCIYKQLDRMVLECVDVLIFRKNHEQIEFLLIHRNRSDEVKTVMKDTWEYPKGGLSYYETHLEAVYREVLEETSITPGELMFCSYLGWQTVDVSKRKKPYNTLRVHGYTLYYIGNPNKKLFSEEGHDKFEWVSLKDAKDLVWMDEASYAHNFFDRWESKQDEILHKAGIRKRK